MSVLPYIAWIIASRYFSGSGSGETPNQYPVQLTPEQKRIADEAWRVYQQGGTEVQQWLRSVGESIIKGLPSPSAPGFQFVSDELKGQPFAGGWVPNIDFSKLPGLTRPDPSKPAATRPDGSPWTVRDIPNLSNEERLNTGREVFNERKATHFAIDSGQGGSGSDNITLSTTEGGGRLPTFLETDPVPGNPKGNRTSYGAPMPTRPQPGQSTAPPPTDGVNRGQPTGAMDRIRSAWDSFKQQHPNWGKMLPQAVIGALAGATGLGVEMILPFLRNEIGGTIASGLPSLIRPPGVGNLPGTVTPAPPTIPQQGVRP